MKLPDKNYVLEVVSPIFLKKNIGLTVAYAGTDENVPENRQSEFASRFAKYRKWFQQTNDIAPAEIDPGDKFPTIGGKKKYFGFLRSRFFWVIALHGQILSWCIVCTNTMTTEMQNAGTSIPALQTLFNYALLFVIFTPFYLYKCGVRKVLRTTFYDCWKFFFFAFADVEGNYFVVKGYEYTNMLSAALLDNFAIVVVVILSFLFLKVKYHWTQYIGILVSIGGMALLIVSDRLTGKDYHASDAVKGDLFILLGAACYGISNTWEEYFVSKRPLYEVLSQLGMYGTIINGVQCAIFERKSVRNAIWSGKVGGYLTGYNLAMLVIYTTAPILFRLSSAAFYNLSLLTSDFWSLLIGTKVFGYKVYWLYPVGFVFVVLGIIGYCAAPMTTFGESLKPWLGKDQQAGIDGVGTARHRLERYRDDEEDVMGDPFDGAVEACSHADNYACQTTLRDHFPRKDLNSIRTPDARQFEF